jgi:3'(2'), 5'-bisphosphate nucleotidase
MGDTSRLLDLASAAALRAGAAIMEIFMQGEFNTRLKDDESPVTEADLISDEIISAWLEPACLPVLSEEGMSIPFGERRKWESFWLIDPLDGTKEFVDHTEGFTVNIALVEGRSPVAGVIYDPVNDVLYAGATGNGALKYQEASRLKAMFSSGTAEVRRHGVNLPLEGPGTYGIVGSRSFMDERTAGFIEKFKEMYPGTRVIIGGSSLKFCRLAEGSADIYPRFSHINEWDSAAGHAILLAAGGHVLQAPDFDLPLLYNKENTRNPWFIAFRDPELLKSVLHLVPPADTPQ